MSRSPMISVPPKATNEVDWISPLKSYIKNTYGDDPERYHEECSTLHRLRQDMRGAGKDSTSGRDLLYRYYGQLEMLDLRFPVDEQHIKITFTWFDAFTHKPTSQHSLAFEKACVIFNICAVLSCHATVQTRTEEAGLKTAYHSFQASAGMFTYINENFLHAPSSDLSRDTVKTVISIMLAQAQEVFLEKQIADQKKVGLLAKLASQAATLYSQAIEGVQDNVNKVIFEKVWHLMVQVKFNYMTSMAQYYQALADDDANSHGTAIARLYVAEQFAKDAVRTSNAFPNSIPPSSNLTADCGAVLAEMTKRHLQNVQDKVRELVKDNDYIYHQPVPAEATVAPVAKLPASKPIPVSELYAGQDIQRITGPDLFARIIPLAVTESASLYDEEKAKLVRAATERVDAANGEMAASLDYLRLPGCLQVLKSGGGQQDVVPEDDFRTWCVDVSDHEEPAHIFEHLATEKKAIVAILGRSAHQLDMEESVCEKMRSKYENEWTQQPSSRLTTTLRNDIRNYREALDEAARSDSQLEAKLCQNETEFDEMRSAARSGEVNTLFQRAVGKVRKSSSSSSPVGGAEANLLDADFDDGGPTVADQIAKVEDILKRLDLVKRERLKVLKDLKDKAHDDDISHILILNKKSLSNYEQQLFQSELEKYRPHQNRLAQASHKQASLMKELTKTFNTLLQDKRVRSEQSKYESVQRQRGAAHAKYKRAYQEFLELEAGLQGAKNWYREMRETVESLEKNVETFVNNRRAEGAQLLNRIEEERLASKNAQAALEHERLRGLMERMSMEPPASPGKPSAGMPRPFSPSSSSVTGSISYPKTNFAGQYQVSASPAPHQAGPGLAPMRSYMSSQTPQPQLPSQAQAQAQQFSQQQTGYGAGTATYNPSVHGRIPGPASPPPNQTNFTFGLSSGPMRSPPPNMTSFPLSFGGTAVLPAQPHQIPVPHTPQPHQQPQPQPQLQQQLPSQQQQQQQQPFQNYASAGIPPPPRGPPPLGPQQTIHYNATEHYGAAQQQQQQHTNMPRPGSTQAPPPSSNAPADPWAGLNAWK